MLNCNIYTYFGQIKTCEQKPFCGCLFERLVQMAWSCDVVLITYLIFFISLMPGLLNTCGVLLDALPCFVFQEFHRRLCTLFSWPFHSRPPAQCDERQSVFSHLSCFHQLQVFSATHKHRTFVTTCQHQSLLVKRPQESQHVELIYPWKPTFLGVQSRWLFFATSCHAWDQSFFSPSFSPTFTALFPSPKLGVYPGTSRFGIKTIFSWRFNMYCIYIAYKYISSS